MKLAILSTLALTGGLIAQAKVYDVNEVIVYGLQDRTAYEGEYIERTTDIGALGKVDYMKVPLVAQTFSKKTIESQNSPGNTLIETITISPSIQSRGEKTYNDITVRGFNISPHDFYLNGVSGMLSQSSVPMNFVESVEVIYGPSSLFLGVPKSGSIGAAINLVPKRAESEPMLTFKETFSGKSNWEHALDMGKRFRKDKALGVRINADYASGYTERDGEKMERANFFANIDFKSRKSNTEILYGYRYVDQYAPDLPLSLNGFDLPKPPNGKANFQLPWSRYRYNNKILTLSHEYQINDVWEWFLKAGYQDEDWNMCMESYWPKLIDNQGNFTATLEDVPIRFWRTSIMSGLRGKLESSSGTHHVSLSVDKLWENGGGQDWFPEDIYQGNIYNRLIADINNQQPIKELEPWYYSGATELSGISLIDRWVSSNQKLVLLGGIRYQKDMVRKNYDEKAGNYTQKYQQTKSLPSLGVMYQLTPKTAVYANYIKGLSRGTLVSKKYLNAGDYLKPKETNQYEVGLKHDGGNTGMTLSVFRIEQEQTGTADVPGAEKKRLEYFGQQRNQGVEWTVFGKAGERLSWYGGLMYLNAKYREGGVVPARSKWRATLVADYAYNDRLTLTGRIQFTGKAPLMKTGDKEVPSWIRLDLGARYHWGRKEHPMEFALNIYNVLNRKYWYASSTDAVYLGAPRNIVASMSYKF